MYCDSTAAKISFMEGLVKDAVSYPDVVLGSTIFPCIF